MSALRRHPRPAAALSLVLAALASILLAFPLPAAAQEGGEEATTTTAAAEGEGSGYTPAVTLPPEAEAEPTPPWTSRFLIPTGLVLAAAAVVVTVVQYFVRVVRNRYRVVE